MAEKYTYLITDFPNNMVSLSKLTDEIEASAIPIPLEGMTASTSQCDISFTQALTATDEVILDGIVAVHDGNPYPVDEFGEIIAQTDAQKEDYKATGQALFSDHPEWRKVFKAMLKEIIDVINQGRNPKCHMGIRGGTTSQTMTSKTWEQITLFNTPEGQNVLSYDTITAIPSANKIEINERGKFYLAYQISFSGAGGTLFLFDIARDGGRTNRLRTKRQLGNTGDVGSCSAVGFLSVPPGSLPADITLWCRNGENQNRAITIEECQIVVFKLDDRVERNINEMMSAIEARFDKDD